MSVKKTRSSVKTRTDEVTQPGDAVQATKKKRAANETLVNARLRALFPAAAAKAEAKTRGDREVTGSFKMLAHDLIMVRPQVRRTFPEAEMEELRASIREIRTRGGGIEGSGVLQALLVSPLPGDTGEPTSYRLIAGEKRFRSTRDEGLAEVPCIVIPEASESLIRLMQLTENALRSPPPVLEEAMAIRDTIDEMDLSLRDMARALGKSLGYITERLSLLKMQEDTQQMVFARANTLRHARLIDPIEDPVLRTELIAAALDGAGEREIRRRLTTQTSGEEGLGAVTSEANTSEIAPAETGLAEVATAQASETPEDKGADNSDGSSNFHNTSGTRGNERAESRKEKQAQTQDNPKQEAGGVGQSGRTQESQAPHTEDDSSGQSTSDALTQTLQTLASFLTEATAQLHATQLQRLEFDADDKQRLRETLASLKKQLAKLEKIAL